MAESSSETHPHSEGRLFVCAEVNGGGLRRGTRMMLVEIRMMEVLRLIYAALLASVILWYIDCSRWNRQKSSDENHRRMMYRAC